MNLSEGIQEEDALKSGCQTNKPGLFSGVSGAGEDEETNQAKELLKINSTTPEK